MISSCVHVTLCFAVLDHWLVGWLVRSLVGSLVGCLVGQLVGLLHYRSEQKLGHQNLHCPMSLGASELAQRASAASRAEQANE